MLALDRKPLDRAIGDPAEIWIASSLDQSRLPSGCQDRQAWSLGRPTWGCRELAVREALRVAQQSLKVDLLDVELLQRHGRDPKVKIEGVYLVQAALDLYLEEVRAVEEADPEMAQRCRTGARAPVRCCQPGNCVHYPALVITRLPGGGSASTIPAGSLVLPYAKLVRHLARPGATTDHFDHLLTLERTGFTATVTLPPARGCDSHRGDAGASWGINENRWGVDSTDWSGRPHLEAEDAHEVRQGCGTALNLPVIHTATLGLHFVLAALVVNRATALENLSLTGSLQRVAHYRWIPGKVLSSTRRTTVGPAPRWWPFYTEADFWPAIGVEELRIAGELPVYVEFFGEVPHLRRLEYSAGQPTRG